MANQQHQAPADLEVREDRRWQEFFWKAQRVGWVLIGLFVVAALLGLTGSGGPLASATARTPTGEIEYPVISRWESKEQLVIRLPSGAAGAVDVELTGDFERVFSTDSILPAPATSVATGDGYRMTFELEGAGEKEIVFNLTAGHPAIARRVTARIGDGPPVDFTVTVLP